MIFNSTIFLVFFFIFFQSYWLINNNFSVQLRNIFTILASYFFYAWWDWRFLGLLIFSSAVDYSAGLLLDTSQNEKFRKQVLFISLVINLGILGFFKYFNFFIESINELLSTFVSPTSLNTLTIILPIGISFYTFQSISYTIDVYRAKQKASTDLLSFFTFVSFFPQLVAGPIERASRLLKQFQEKKQFSYSNSVCGLRLILWGMFLKIVIADNFGLLANQVFDSSSPISGSTTILGALFFAFQIYADFSGYSTIARGLARLLGIELMRNFRSPYFSNSLTQFWHRWHISLSIWFKDYVYIPLGGNRKHLLRAKLNLLLTFLLSGIWHGANFTFIIWGGLHGLLLLLEKQFHFFKVHYLSTLATFCIVSLLWIPFRAENAIHLLKLFQSIIDFSSYSSSQISQIIFEFSLVKFGALISILFFFLKIESQLEILDFSEWLSRKNNVIRISYYYFLLISILLLGNFKVSPSFIYFQF